MKVTIIIEAEQDGQKARRIKVVEVPNRVLKMFEVFGSDNLVDTVAEDVMSNALKAVMVVQPRDTMSSAPAVDGNGKPTGRSMMEESLGLDIIENMMTKEPSGGIPAAWRKGGR